jgi:hypothetical protein
LNIVTPLLANSDDSDQMDIDGENSKRDDEMCVHVGSRSVRSRQLTSHSKENTRAAAVEAVFDSLNPHAIQGSDLSGKVSDAIDLAARLEFPSAKVRKASYDSIARAFRRMEDAGVGASIDFDVSSLKTLLCSSEEIEAMRLARADAIVVLQKSTPRLFAALAAEIRALRASERSPAVQDRLPAA